MDRWGSWFRSLYGWPKIEIKEVIEKRKEEKKWEDVETKKRKKTYMCGCEEEDRVS